MEGIFIGFWLLVEMLPDGLLFAESVQTKLQVFDLVVLELKLLAEFVHLTLKLNGFGFHYS